MNKFNIEQFLSLEGYEETRKDRRKNSEVNSQEFFTPYSIVKRKKFDVVLMNPPYSDRNLKDPIHLQFVEKCFNICDKQVSIFPYILITKVGNAYNEYKEKFNKYLKLVEEVDSKNFEGTAMPNAGIYVFDNNKNIDENIEIIPLNNDKYTVKSLLSISNFSKYEQEIIKYLGINKNLNIRYCQPNKKNIEIDINKIINSLSENKVYLTANAANGAMDATWFSKTVGKIFIDKDKLKEDILNRRGARCFILSLDNIKIANNLKKSLENPLLRFILLRQQNGQSISAYYFKYIPDIDWSDDRVKTDEGLLEVCGCPKDKCKEYADYCKKIIEEVDRKK